MNVEIGTEAVQFPEQEYINGIFVAVRSMENNDEIVRKLSRVSCNGVHYIAASLHI